jgi:hypothetical protein
MRLGFRLVALFPLQEIGNRRVDVRRYAPRFVGLANGGSRACQTLSFGQRRRHHHDGINYNFMYCGSELAHSPDLHQGAITPSSLGLPPVARPVRARASLLPPTSRAPTTPPDDRLMNQVRLSRCPGQFHAWCAGLSSLFVGFGGRLRRALVMSLQAPAYLHSGSAADMVMIDGPWLPQNV